MAEITLRPSADGSTTGFTRFPDSGTFAARVVDDPDSHDSDTSYIQGPNVADGSLWVALDDVAADFDVNNITTITLKASAKKIEGGVSQLADTTDLYLQIQRTDEATAITTESAVCNVTDTGSYILFTRTVTVTGAHSLTDWNAAKLKLRQDYTVVQMADTTASVRITAVEVVIDYVPLPRRAQVSWVAFEVPEAPIGVGIVSQRLLRGVGA